MEYGLIPTINQYADNNQVLIQQVQPSSEITNAKLREGDEAKDIAKSNFLKPKDEIQKNGETQETKQVDAKTISQYQEVVLTNLNFGFNDKSKDFYVKAIRGEAENQYPTDEMMKLKAYLMAQSKAELEQQIAAS